jgi:hypothetical protein
VLGGDLGLVGPEVVEEGVWITDDRYLVPRVPGDDVHQRYSHIQHTKQLQTAGIEATACNTDKISFLFITTVIYKHSREKNVAIRL